MQWFANDLALYYPPPASQRCRRSGQTYDRTVEQIMAFNPDVKEKSAMNQRLYQEMSKIQSMLTQHKTVQYSLYKSELESQFRVNTELYNAFRRDDAEFYEMQIYFYDYLKTSVNTGDKDFDLTGISLEVAVNDEICLQVVYVTNLHGMLEFYELCSGYLVFALDLGEYYQVILNRQVAYAQLGKYLCLYDRALIIEYFGYRAVIVCPERPFRALLALL